MPGMELRPLATLVIQTDPNGLFMLGTTSVGKRIIQEFLTVRLEGERLSGTMVGRAGADWLTVDDAGNATMDIRVLVETGDGAKVLVIVNGKANWGQQVGRGAIYSSVVLESGDEAYQWVNNLPLVSKGEVGEGGSVAHRIFEMV
jgi:hypothetical protein